MALPWPKQQTATWSSSFPTRSLLCVVSFRSESTWTTWPRPQLTACERRSARSRKIRLTARTGRDRGLGLVWVVPPPLAPPSALAPPPPPPYSAAHDLGTKASRIVEFLKDGRHVAVSNPRAPAPCPCGVACTAAAPAPAPSAAAAAAAAGDGEPGGAPVHPGGARAPGRPVQGKWQQQPQWRCPLAHTPLHSPLRCTPPPPPSSPGGPSGRGVGRWHVRHASIRGVGIQLSPHFSPAARPRRPRRLPRRRSPSSNTPSASTAAAAAPAAAAARGQRCPPPWRRRQRCRSPPPRRPAAAPLAVPMRQPAPLGRSPVPPAPQGCQPRGSRQRGRGEPLDEDGGGGAPGRPHAPRGGGGRKTTCWAATGGRGAARGEDAAFPGRHG